MATEHENWVDWARQSAEAEFGDLRVEWQAAIARAETAEAALAQCQHERDKPCPWKRTDFGFESLCGYLTTFTADEFLFCPGCGHPVEAQP